MGPSGSKWSSLVAQTLKYPPEMQETQFDAWVRKIPWRSEWLLTPVFLPGGSHGQRSLVGYSPWGHKELDRTEQLTLSLLLVLNIITSGLLWVPWKNFCLVSFAYVSARRSIYLTSWEKAGVLISMSRAMSEAEAPAFPFSLRKWGRCWAAVRCPLTFSRQASPRPRVPWGPRSREERSASAPPVRITVSIAVRSTR